MHISKGQNLAAPSAMMALFSCLIIGIRVGVGLLNVIVGKCFLPDKILNHICHPHTECFVVRKEFPIRLFLYYIFHPHTECSQGNCSVGLSNDRGPRSTCQPIRAHRLLLEAHLGLPCPNNSGETRWKILSAVKNAVIDLEKCAVRVASGEPRPRT